MNIHNLYDVCLIGLSCYKISRYLIENVVLAGDILFLQIVECSKVSNAHTNSFDFELCDNSQ